MSASIRDTFFEECEDLLEALTEGLADLEHAPDSQDTINAVFRAVHSIKGGAGAFALDDLVSFAHTFETVLDKLRARDLTCDAALMRLLHRSADQLAILTEAARDETEADPDPRDAVVRDLEAYLDPSDAEEEFSFDGLALDFDPAPVAEPQVQRFAIRFTASERLYQLGHEPLLIFDQLRDLGTLTVQLDEASVPDFTALQDEAPHLTWKLELTTPAVESAIRDAFDFVEGLCEIEITVLPPDPEPSVTPAQEDAQTPPSPAPSTADMPAKAAAQPETAAATPPAATAPAAKGPSAEPREAKGPKPSVRVELGRVDRLINTVGELIINQAMINQCIEELDLPPTSKILNEIEDYKLLARDIQEGVMAIRAQPVKPLFQRMGRIVREASDATGKQVRFVTIGENTEVDKTVIERLADPLTHMIRNSVDHGLESEARRIEAGKDPVGEIRLSAAHRSGTVVIEISDDGAGINRPVVHKKAIEKGLVQPDADLTDAEIDNLLFAPGFSTAAEVSALSGRGVGMDVVRTAVQQLGGRITVNSTPGKGTTFSIVLPLTLAVMDGFVISVADQTMVVPIASIFETVSAANGEIHHIGSDERLMKLRGRYMRIVNVARSLNLDERLDGDDAIYLIVESETAGMYALEIGQLHDQRQIVVKSLDPQFAKIPGVSAATILGDGKIALILDTEQIVQTAGPQSADARALIHSMELTNA